MNDNNGDGTAIAVLAEPMGERRLSKIEQWEDTYLSIRHSFDVETDDGRLAYIKCLSGSDVEAQRATGKPLLVTGWLIHLVERADDATGEVSDGLRMCLLLADGTTISTGSGSLIDNWAHVARMFAAVKPWPALEIEIGAVKSSNGKGHYLQLKSIKRFVPAEPTRTKK